MVAGFARRFVRPRRICTATAAGEQSKPPRANIPTTLSGLPARDIVLTIEQNGNHVTEHQIAARKGMTLYILTTDSLTETVADCQSDFQFIQQHLALPK
jgi:hypothetical protein